MRSVCRTGAGLLEPSCHPHFLYLQTKLNTLEKPFLTYPAKEEVAGNSSTPDTDAAADLQRASMPSTA